MNFTKDIRQALTTTFVMGIVLFALTELSILALFSVLLFIFFSSKFFFELGKKIEIKDLLICIALLQCVIGPLLAYRFNPNDKFYYMAVDEDTYLSYVFPACLLFIAGLYFPIVSRRIDENLLLERTKFLLKHQPNLDIIFIGIGSLAELLIDFFPDQIRFAIALIGSARFIGLYFLVLNDRPYKWLIFGFGVSWLFTGSLEYGMFHDLLLWVGFLFIILAFIFRLQFRTKLLIGICLFVGVYVIQTVKHEYRNLISASESTGISKAEIFFTIVMNKFSDYAAFFAEENTNAMITRINQGWIIARIMSWTPSKEPYAEGETISTAIRASLVPRFLDPEKIEAGGRTYFTRFTGKALSKKTSMGLSTIGEAYANYGPGDGAIFMFIIGLFYNLIINRIYKVAQNHPTLILFLPLIFLQVVKAEVDFAVVLNYLIKAIIAVTLLMWGTSRFLGLKL